MLTSGAVGYGLLTAFRYRPRRMTSYWLAGLVGCTVYAETWSLFGGVGLAANLVMAAGCAAIVVLRRKELSADIRKGTDAVRSVLCLSFVKGWPQALRAVLWVVFVMLLALGTSGGNWHTDTPLYHAQAIHWIESYGAVKGLGNLQSHFAYNNSCFSLYALYSFHWLGEQSFHAVQGFLAVLLMTLCLSMVEIPSENRSIGVAGFLRMAAGLQIALLYDELVSPSSDCFVLLLVPAILILWAEIEEGQADAISCAMIAMLAVYATTVKLAAAPLVLLAVRPICRLLRPATDHVPGQQSVSESKSSGLKTILRFVLLAFLITLPFLIRNLILSGWILYPVLPQHLAELPWQIPDGVGQFESFEIRQNGRMIFDMNLADTSLTGWIYDWLVRQPKMARILLYAALAGMLPVLIRLAVFLVRCVSSKRQPLREKACTASDSRLFLEFVLAVCLLFWFFTTPQIRFGEGYLLTFLAVVYGGLFCDLLRLLPDRARRVIETPIPFIALIVIVGLLSGSAPGRDPAGQTHLLLQQDYDRYPVRAYYIDGIEFYCPTDFVYTGYYDFPATRWEVTDVRALGKHIDDGFCASN